MSSSDLLVQRQLWEGAFERLEADITGGLLAPGTKLVEEDLAQRFGVSRVPIRVALRELVRRGLAIDRPRQGVSVSTLTESDLEEVFLIREALETTAGRLAVRRIHSDEIGRLRNIVAAADAAYATEDSESGLALDLKFHRSIFELSGGQRLLGMFDHLAAQTQLLLRSNLRTYGRGPNPPPGQHTAIVDALADKSEKRLDKAIHDHYSYYGDRLFTATTAAAAGRRPIERLQAPPAAEEQRAG